MNKKNLLLPILMMAFVQNSMFCFHSDSYGVAGVELATAIARAGAVISDSEFVKTDAAKVEKSGKLSKTSIVALARIANDLASFYSYKEIKNANNGFCGKLDQYNNFRYVALLWSLQDVYLLYSEVKASKVVKAEKTESVVSEKDKKKAEIIKLLKSKILPAAESIAAVARSVEGLRVTSRSCLNAGKAGFVGKCNLDYWCTFVITASRILDEMLSSEKFSVREALIVSQAVIFAGVVILDFIGYIPSLEKAKALLFENKKAEGQAGGPVGDVPVQSVAPVAQGAVVNANPVNPATARCAAQDIKIETADKEIGYFWLKFQDRAWRVQAGPRSIYVKITDKTTMQEVFSALDIPEFQEILISRNGGYNYEPVFGRTNFCKQFGNNLNNDLFKEVVFGYVTKKTTKPTDLQP